MDPKTGTPLEEDQWPLRSSTILLGAKEVEENGRIQGGGKWKSIAFPKESKMDERNVNDSADWTELTSPQRAVLIAQDVIQLLDENEDPQTGYRKIVLETGTYFSVLATFETLTRLSKDKESDARPFLLEKDVSCRVCAIGALFLAHIFRFDKVSIGSIQETKRISYRQAALCRDNLENHFEPFTLRLIEAAFEQDRSFAAFTRPNGSSVFWQEGKPIPDNIDFLKQRGEWAEKFGLNYENDGERLRAICQNIIDNNGTFIPPNPEETV